MSRKRHKPAPTSPPSKRARVRADAASKNELGPVPAPHATATATSTSKQLGTYAGQRKAIKTTPSGRPVEADHMTPDSLHQPIGQKRKSPEGQRLSQALPAAQIDKLMHRRKNTTGSGHEVEHQRAYLLNAHHGRVPFAGPMEKQQDFNAAAMQIDLSHTVDDRVLFGEKSMHDPRPVTAPTHKPREAVPFADAQWSLQNTNALFDTAAAQGRITQEQAKRLQSAKNSMIEEMRARYETRGLPTTNFKSVE